MPSQFNNIYRDPLDSFTDREQILELFEQFLLSAQSNQFRLLAVKGNSGTGKTFLISYLIHCICPKLHWQSGIISFAQSIPDFRFFLTDLEDALKKCVPRESLKRYRIKRNEYNRRFDEYRALITVNQNNEANNQSLISDVNQRVHVNIQLRERELQLRAELSHALIELAEESEHPLCLFIDGYERISEADPELIGWLWEQILPRLVKAAPQPLHVITCGWEWPSNAVVKPFAYTTELTDFDMEQIRNYLEKQGALPLATEPLSLEQERLVTAFYELTRGHPLVLGLTVTYFNTLDDIERNASSLQADRPLVSEKARIEFLEERLLSRLSEPFRTLLEHGPILRSFDQSALKALLSVPTENITSELDDRGYNRFLRYPFIKQLDISNGESEHIQLAFHELVRQVGLFALQNHPQTKEQLHRKMADYYREIAEAEWKKAHLKLNVREVGKVSTYETNYDQWLAEISEEEFRACLEWLYHALQIEEYQAAVFETWNRLTGQAVTKWRRGQAGSLLKVIEQLVEEGEPFLSKTSYPYGCYLLWYSRFLTQGVLWEEARNALKQAIKIFEHGDNATIIALCYNNIGITFLEQGKFEQALSYFQRALAICEQGGHPSHIATCLNSIGSIYQMQGKLGQALEKFEQALAYDKQVGNPMDIAASLHNIGGNYQSQGELVQALSYYEEALTLKKQVGNDVDVAISLNNIGGVYEERQDHKQALEKFEQALAIYEKMDNLTGIALSLNNIGSIYSALGKLGKALSYFERALILREQIDNLIDIADSFHNIGSIYQKMGRPRQAIKRYVKAFRLFKQLGHGFESRAVNELEKQALCYGQLGEIEKAVACNVRAKQIRDSLLPL